MQGRKTGKVYKVTLIPPKEAPLFPSQEEYITKALSPGRSTTRYGRDWIIGRTTREAELLTGRIGFRGAEGLAELWNEETKDFEQVAVPAGLTAPFVINLRNLRMALQPRGSEIKLNGLVGAFRNLLTQDGEAWQIVMPQSEISFEAWRSSVDRVTAARFRLRKPNPHYTGTPDLEAVMEQAEAEVAVLEVEAKTGLDTEATFLAQSQSHVQRGYGEARYKGLRGLGTSAVHETIYNSALGSEEEALDIQAGADGEVLTEDLAAILESEQGLGETENHGPEQEEQGR